MDKESSKSWVVLVIPPKSYALPAMPRNTARIAARSSHRGSLPFPLSAMTSPMAIAGAPPASTPTTIQSLSSEKRTRMRGRPRRYAVQDRMCHFLWFLLLSLTQKRILFAR